MTAFHDVREQAMDGLLQEWSQQPSGGVRAAFVQQVMHHLDGGADGQAAVEQVWAQTSEERQLLALRAHDGRLQAEGMRAWQGMCADQSDCAALDGIMQRLSGDIVAKDSATIDIDARMAAIMTALPAALPTQTFTLRLSSLIAACGTVSVLVAVGLGSQAALTRFSALLLMINIVVLALLTWIAVVKLGRWHERLRDASNTSHSLLRNLLDVRVRPAPAAAIIVAGVFIPGSLLVGSNFLGVFS